MVGAVLPMSDNDVETPSPSRVSTRGGTPWRRGLRAVGAAIAIVLLGLAVAYALRDADLTRLRAASPAFALGLLALVLVNVIASGLLFWAVTRPFDARPPVGPVRMVELIALSGLLNYVPLIRAGLVGRTAYLKAAHDLPIRQSLVTIAIVAVVAVAAAIPPVVLLFPWEPALEYGALVGGWVVLTLATPAVGRVSVGRPVRPWGWAWGPLRVLDMLAAAGRLWLAFRIVGYPIGFDDALVAGAAGMLTRLVVFLPNGLGLSEWVVALLAGAMAPVSAAEGVAAALVDRAAEVVVAIATGALAAWRLRGPLKALAAASAPPSPHTPGSASSR